MANVKVKAWPYTRAKIDGEEIWDDDLVDGGWSGSDYDSWLGHLDDGSGYIAEISYGNFAWYHKDLTGDDQGEVEWLFDWILSNQELGEALMCLVKDGVVQDELHEMVWAARRRSISVHSLYDIAQEHMEALRVQFPHIVRYVDWDGVARKMVQEGVLGDNYAANNAETKFYVVGG